MLNYVDDTQQKSNRKIFYSKRSELIKKLSYEHRDNPKLLLKLLANTKNKLLYKESDIAIANDEPIISELFGNEDDVIYKEVVDSDECDEESSDEHVESEPANQHRSHTAAESHVPEIDVEDCLNFSGHSGISIFSYKNTLEFVECCDDLNQRFLKLPMPQAIVLKYYKYIQICIPKCR